MHGKSHSGVQHMSTINSRYLAVASLVTAAPAYGSVNDFVARAIYAVLSVLLCAPLLSVTFICVGLLVLLIALQPREQAAPVRRPTPARASRSALVEGQAWLVHALS